MPSGGGMVTVSQAKVSAEPISPLSGMTHPLPNATPPPLLPSPLPHAGNLPPNSPAFTSGAVFGSNPNLLAQESQLLVSSSAFPPIDPHLEACFICPFNLFFSNSFNNPITEYHAPMHGCTHARMHPWMKINVTSHL